MSFCILGRTPIPFSWSENKCANPLQISLAVICFICNLKSHICAHQMFGAFESREDYSAKYLR
jgi:hypothetical protein